MPSAFQRVAAAAGIIVCLVGPVSAAKPEPIQFIEGVLDTTPYLSKHFGVQNNTDQVLRQVSVQCGFFTANGDLVATGLNSEFNIAPGDTAYDTIYTFEPGGDDFTADCRVFQ